MITCLLLSCGDESGKQSNDSSGATSAQNTQSGEGIKSASETSNQTATLDTNELTPFRVMSVSEGVYDNTSALQINFNLAVSQEQDFSQVIRVKKKGELLKTDWIFSENKMVLYYPFIEATTQYEINISQSLLSEQGKMLTQAVNKKITTQQKKKSARFLSKGNTLLSSDHDLPIEAVNVEAVELKFWRIKKDSISVFLQYPNKTDVYSLNRLPEMAELVYTSQFKLEQTKNKLEQHKLPIQNIGAIKNNGVYFVTMMPADATYAYDYESTWFIHTDIGIHSRMYKVSLAVFAHQLPQASVYENVSIQLFNNKGELVKQGVTDAQGFVSLDVTEKNKLQYILASRDDKINLIRLNQPKFDLSEFDLANRIYHPQELFLYAPRDLYRPGETVNINGLLRDAGGALVTASPLYVEIRRPDNRLFKTFNWQGDKQAFYQTEFKLPSDAMTGSWRFIARLANKDSFNYELAVEDFLPEKLKLALSIGNVSNHVTINELPKIKIQSDYLYGAPASGNRYDATVTVSAATQLFEGYESYVFGSNSYREFDNNFTTKAAKLNAQGFAELMIPSQWKGTLFPLQINSHVNVYESGGRPISRNIRQYIWPNDVVVGIKPNWTGKLASPQQMNTVSLVALNSNAEKVGLEQAEITLIQENRERYWHWGDDGWDYRNNEQEIPVFNAVVNIKSDADNSISLPLDFGRYRIEIRNQAQQLISSYHFFSGWRWYDPYGFKGEKPDQVKLAWQADDLTAGQPAELSITAPFAGTALVTVESDEMLWHHSFKMDSAASQIKVPIDKAWRRNDLYASVMVVQAGHVSKSRAHLPQRAFGLIHLPLNRQANKLHLNIQHLPKTLPDEPLTVTIKADNLDADQTTYVTLAAVDTGVLSVSNFKTPMPFEWFFSKRQYFPALRDVYGSLIEMIEGKSAVQKFGGDADLTHGGDEAKADVQIVSLLTDKVVFDSNGEAKISLPIPYFNGELRLMAVAFNDYQYAGQDSRVKVAAPVVVETSMPRFLAKGDASVATIDIHNTEEHSTEIQLDISADDALGGARIEQSLNLAADEKQILQLPLAGKTHQGAFRVRVKLTSADGFELIRSWQLALRPAMPAVMDQYKAVVKVGESYSSKAIEVEKFDTLNLKAMLTLSDTPVLNREDQLYQLLQYPYGCLEQTSSRAWPLLFAEPTDFGMYQNKQQNRLFNDRFGVISEAISRLLGMQLYSGGFGAWSNNSPEEYWLTVYVTDFLIEAKKLGHHVPDEALKKAVKRLQSYARNASQINSDLAKYLSDRNHFEISYKAYAAYVLAGMKQISLQDLRRLYDEFNEFAHSPLPLAHLAMGLELLGDERRAQQAWLQAIDFKWNRKRHDYYGDYGSRIRDYAEVITLGTQSHVLKQMQQSTLDLIVPLQQDMVTRPWLSTQERSTLFKTAKKLKQTSSAGSEWQVSLSQAAQTEVIKQNHDYSNKWLGDEVKKGLTVDNTGQKPVFLDMKYQGYLKEHKSESHGLLVSKKYYDINGKHIDLSQIKSGDFILAHIEISLEEKFNYLPDALLVDLLPAGLELENQNLEHALKLDDIKVDGKYVRDWGTYTHIKHSEFKDDRFVAALNVSSYKNAHVFYLARAVTPGDYVIPPSLVEDMYRPEIRATSDNLGHLIIK